MVGHVSRLEELAIAWPAAIRSGSHLAHRIEREIMEYVDDPDVPVAWRDLIDQARDIATSYDAVTARGRGVCGVNPELVRRVHDLADAWRTDAMMDVARCLADAARAVEAA